MFEKAVRTKRLILSILLTTVIGLGVLSGVPVLSSLGGGHVSVAYADDCADGPHPPPSGECPGVPTSTPTATPTEVDH